MDDVSRCREQLASFRIRELKDVLSRLGLPKQGKKQVLMEKIMGVLVPTERPAIALKSLGRGANKNALSREDCVNVIDDIYRKLRGSAAPDLASAGKKDVGAGSSSVARSEEPDEAGGLEASKTRCPCGNSRDMGTMIQCDEAKCGVWQHINCVVIPEKADEKAEPEVPNSFYCEQCRINRSDPFCATVTPITATKLQTTGTRTEGQSPMQNVEKTFNLSTNEKDMISRPNYDLQVWCVLLNDKVPFRMHWPAFADLRINGVSVRVTNRPGGQLLGANGRDEGPGITTYAKDGTNRIAFSAYDARPFCIGVRIIRRNTLAQVLASIPDVNKGEDFEEAIARVRRAFNGGGQGNADDGDDSDLEVVAESVSVTLRCPMSGGRIKVAGRFKPCTHMGCFDLNTFVEMNQRARKWQCPICLKNYSLENLVIDPYFNRVTSALKGYAEDVTEVELKPDGLWRPKVEGEKSRDPWRTPDGVKRAVDGQWAVSPAKRANGWASANAAGPSERAKPTVNISRSSSATDSNDEENGEDGERSVNQEQEPSEKDENNGYLDENEVEFSSRGAHAGSAWPTNKAGPSEKQPAADVIVLSDTDDEDGDIMVVGSSDSMWPPAIRPSTGPYNYFSTSSDHINSSSVQHNPPIRPTAVQAVAGPYGLTSNQQTRDPGRSTGWKFGRSPTRSQSNSECNGASNDGGLVVTSRDCPLRLLLPHQPARAQTQPSLREPHEEVDNTWFSLSIPGHDNNSNPVPARRDKQRPASQGRACFDSLAETASEVLLGMNSRSGQAENRSKAHSSPPYGSPVDSLSPAPTSPPYGRVPAIQSSSPRSNSHRSPAVSNRHHRHSYFRVDSDSD
ncbi:hypothetical protein MPTK1_6g08590 [Marchantia polymorpha subsp. ruderalis]|uniref:E3 SUMO-protein ligase SIZ1 n=2 Tax=Marchantia polymorpha TaxID=3197 RepID=A0AAF6BPY2_MARPO|nr:hypothetical protein MARPO_0060s0062 [Marchantia polymorpha]BBN14066.1 hypothetical protein Mp_6g08590 [Marchantia polymorpha subsp. ruderalis]|eukprot:PTQ36978.1 hypothetical protein MARPO_0060s0062 [Marchantia polymorpha]